MGPGVTPGCEMFYSDPQAHTFKGQKNMTGSGLNDFFFFNFLYVIFMNDLAISLDSST